MAISNDLRRFIESCGFSRYEIAQRSGVTQGALSKFMAGAHVTTRTLDALAPVLGLRLVADDRVANSNRNDRRLNRKAGR